MKHKCFISFKTKDMEYKESIQELGIDMIDKSLNEPLDLEDEDAIMRKIREDYLSDSTVTIFLIGEYSAEKTKGENQAYIKRELQASLYNGKNNTRNGILGVVLPEMYNKIYKGSHKCNVCGDEHNKVAINDSTVIKEFSCNYYLPGNKKNCCWAEDERYCVLVKYDDFMNDPETYIEKAYDKRSAPVAKRVIVYPKDN